MELKKQGESEIQNNNLNINIGAGSETRTRTGVNQTVFETAASTIPPSRQELNHIHCTIFI